jgi:prepilin-type processing-associated H-X9-DG protein
VKNEQVFNCPSHSLTQAPSLTQFSTYIYYGRLTAEAMAYGSYTINHSYRGCVSGAGVCGGSGPWTPPVSHPSLNEIVSFADSPVPAQTVWAMDGNGDFFFGPSSGVVGVTGSEPRQLQNAIERHLRTINTLFVDGHVKAMSADTLAKRNAAGTVLPYFTIQND